jgi:hypothetical protein
MMNHLLILPLLGLAGCAPGYWDPPAAEPISAAELDRACITAAGDKLSSLFGHEEATHGRIVPMPAGNSGPSGSIVDERTVELDARSAGLPMTYVFYCWRFVDGQIIAQPIGRKV